jgi:hypothetical protein
MMAIRSRCKTLFEPIDLASLVAFRVLFGLLMSASMVRFLVKGWVEELYLQPTFFFTYPGFSWVQPWPAWGMYAHVALLALLALLIAGGWYYRVSTVLFCGLFTYLELLDQTNYLNHYYLISLISFLMIFCPLHRAVSLDAWRRRTSAPSTAPAGILWLLRSQIALVYLFAGLSKLNGDWLGHAQPLNIWLSAHTDFPFLGGLFGQVWVHYAMSWTTVIFELTIVGFLLWRRTRLLAYVMLVGFHLITLMLFHIGMFPWIMIVMTTLFFPPDWPRRWWRPRHAMTSSPPVIRTPPRRWQQRAGLTFALLYLTIQCAVPLRPYAVPGYALWTENGMRFAWRVMLAEKTGHVDFEVRQPHSGRAWWVSPNDYLTPRQAKMMATRPDMIQRLAQTIAHDYRQKGLGDVEVHAAAYASLNGRPSQRLIDFEVDLAQTQEKLSGTPWGLPLRETAPVRLRAASPRLLPQASP